MPSENSGQPLPTTNGDIDVERVKFDDPGDPAGPFCRQHGRAASAKWVEDDTVPTTAVADQIRNEGNRLCGRMQFELASACRMEAVDPGIIENIGPVPPLTSQAKIIDVRRGTVLEGSDQLMLAAVEAALTGIGFVPDQ